MRQHLRPPGWLTADVPGSAIGPAASPEDPGQGTGECFRSPEYPRSAVLEVSGIGLEAPTSGWHSRCVFTNAIHSRL